MTCPTCGKAVTSREAPPFCSAVCRRADLGSWLDGDYRIAGAPVDLDVDRSDEHGTERWDD